VHFKGLVPGILLCCIMVLAVPSAKADSVVHFRTSLGSFDVQLYDTATPVTVANFLNYVNHGFYQNAIIHRSVSNFVIQGGGIDVFESTFQYLPTFAPIINESVIGERSNVRGTIAMARQTGLHTATSQFFFNTVDNLFLDKTGPDDGYAVFGHVLGDGMDVVDALAALSHYTGLGRFYDDWALQNFTQTDYINNAPLYVSNPALMEVSPEFGDCNGDGSVDVTDLGVLATNWETVVPMTSGVYNGRWLDGDCSGDRLIDNTDLELMASNWSTGGGAITAPADLAITPEPATMSLLALGGLTLLRKKRRN